MSKENSVIASLIYKFSERVIVKLIAFVISIVLARLIEPATFGLLAILTVFVNLSQVFVQGGLNVALIQNKETRREDYSTVFWISLLIAIIIYIILFACAPLIAKYYDSQELISPLRVLSISMIFGAFNSVQTAKLSREMQFRKQLFCNLISTIIAGIFGIFMACRGFGLWALVAYNLLSQVVICFAMLTVANWFPSLTFSFQRARIFVGYGWKILISNLMYSLYTDIRSLIIGKVYTTNDLALYDRANQFPNIISYNLETALQSVMLPALSKNQSDLVHIKLDLSRMIRTITFVVTPIMVGIAAIAEPFVLVVLSEKWASCIPYMMIFSVGYVFLPITGSCNVTIKAIGRSDVFAKNQAIRIVTMFVILIVSVFAFHSVTAIVIGYTISLFSETLIAIWPVRKYIGYTYKDSLMDVLPNLLISIAMGIFVRVLCQLIHNIFIALVVGILVGVIVFLLLAYLFKLPALQEIIKVRSAYRHKL